jgi:hypothetical protein
MKTFGAVSVDEKLSDEFSVQNDPKKKKKGRLIWFVFKFRFRISGGAGTLCNTSATNVFIILIY